MKLLNNNKKVYHQYP